MFDISLSKKSKTVDKGCVKLAILFIFVAILFILIGHIYPKQIQAVLKKELFKLPEASIDWWSVSHFGLFCILGYLFPDHLLELLLIGVAWEIIEDALSPPDSKILVDCKKKYPNWLSEKFRVLWCDYFGLSKDYWYAKWDDIFSNVLGIILGHYLRVC